MLDKFIKFFYDCIEPVRCPYGSAGSAGKAGPPAGRVPAFEVIAWIYRR